MKTLGDKAIEGFYRKNLTIQSLYKMTLRFAHLSHALIKKAKNVVVFGYDLVTIHRDTVRKAQVNSVTI